MATYKVIQDIEAEDKLVGPLTLRQFIYAGVAAVCLYICFLAYTRNAQFLIAVFLPIAAGAGFFAFPWRGEQPTEIWALARLRFAVKPRVRIWDQDGMKDLVTITVPKRIAPVRSAKADLSQAEVQSRLKALADTIDSRGWATRNAAYGIQQNWAHPTVAPVPAAYAPAVSMPNDDMFDEKNSVAQNFDAMLAKSTQQKRQRVLQEIAQAQRPQPPQPQPQMTAQAYGYGSPQLPAPVMPALALPAAPAMPMPAAAVPPTQPAMPQATAQTPQPAGNTPNNYWFANGPAYPANPAPAQVQAQGQPPAMPAPMPAAAPVVMPTPSITVPAPARPASPLPPQVALPMAPGMPAPSAGRIESDAPLAAAAVPTDVDVAAGQSIKEKNEAMAINYAHMRVLRPTGSETDASGVPIDAAQAQFIDGQTAAATPAQPVTRTPDPAILELANNDDLDIATIARQASKEIKKSPDEVEIQLH